MGEGRLLEPLTPLLRIARGMNDGIDGDGILDELVENGVGKSPDQPAAISFMHEGGISGWRRIDAKHASTELNYSSPSPAR